MSWTDERVALLKQLWGEGKTAAEIAKELGDGVTRNAVIGKAHRLKLSGRASPIQQGKKKAAAKEQSNTKTEAEKPAPAQAGKQPRAKQSEAGEQVPYISTTRKQAREIANQAKGKGVSLAELKERMCRWPVGDPREAGFHFCGARAEYGLPYCYDHACVAYQTSSRKAAAGADELEKAEKKAAKAANGGR